MPASSPAVLGERRPLPRTEAIERRSCSLDPGHFVDPAHDVYESACRGGKDGWSKGDMIQTSSATVCSSSEGRWARKPSGITPTIS